jgi:outer membrane protein OmpU
MKKSLLATTALAALGAVAVASPASAQFEVGISGYMEQWIGYSDNANTANPNSDVFDQISDAEFNVTFKQTLDNGLTIGGEIQIEGQQPGGAPDEQYIYVDGEFGRFLIGSENGAGNLMHYGLRSNGIGLDAGDVSSWVAGAQGALRDTNATSRIDDDQNKVTYFTPRINGFQVGASFVPDSDDVNGTTPGTAGHEADGNRDSGWSVGGNYMTSIADMSVRGSVSYMDAGGDGGAAVFGNETALSTGIQLGFGGFTTSFAYGEYENDSGAGNDINVFGVTLAYNAGPAGVSIGYVRGEDSDDDAQQDAFELGASYAVGPGVNARTSLYYVDGVNDGNSVADGVGVVAGLALSF